MTKALLMAGIVMGVVMMLAALVALVVEAERHRRVHGTAAISTTQTVGMLGMIGCASLMLAISNGLLAAHRIDGLEDRLEAVEKTHQTEERLSPLVEEIYTNIHDLQDRCGTIEAFVGYGRVSP